MKKKSKRILEIVILLLFLLGINGISYLLSYLRYDNSIQVEIEVLQEENARLQEENDTLNKTLKIDFGKNDYVMAKVLVRDIHNFYKEVTLNRGENDGIKKGMAVVNEEGLVAVIEHVDKDTSVAKLLSGDYNVSVEISKTYGNLSNGNVDMLDKYVDIKEGDGVYTSGLSYIPKGIYVGKVLSVNFDKDNLSKEVKVDLINNKNLNYVAIIVGGI